MTLWEFSVKRPVFAWMFMFAMIIFGYFSYTRLGISQNPDVDIPTVNITINWEGAAPEVIELDVIDIVEGQLSTIAGVKGLNSNARRGQASISVEFEINKDIDLAVQEIQAKILQAQRNLPKDIEPAIITKVNPEDRPIFWIGVTTENMARRELMIYVRDHIKDRFQTVEGVSDIILGGYVEPNLRIYPSLDALTRYDLTPLDLISAMQTEQKELPGGSIQGPETELIIRTLGEVNNAEDFSKIAINRRGGAPNYIPIMLKDVALVEDGLADVARISRVNGKSSIGLGIRKQRGANAVEVGKRVKAKLAEIKKQLAPGLDIDINYDGTQFVEEAISELKFTIFVSSLMTALVVFLFLRTFNSTLNIVLSIPTVVFASFLAIDFFGFTLNTFTMMALTLAVGMIVDDNIMVLENINRWYAKTKNWETAAIEGTKEIFSAVMATSLAVIAIFLPIGYMEGITGLFFYQFAIALSAAIFFSTLDSLIFTPMRAAQLSAKASSKELQSGERFKMWQEKYHHLLSMCLQKPVLVLLSSLLFMSILTVGSFILVKKEFLPAQDQSLLMLMIKTPPGTSLAKTDTKMKEIEKVLLSTPQIKRYFASVGGFQGNEPNNAFAYITLHTVKERPSLEGKKRPGHLLISDYLRKTISAKVQGVFVMVQDPSSQGFTRGRGQGAEIEFKITGPEWKVLSELVEKYKKIMNESKQVTDVDSNFKGDVRELHVVPNRLKAMQRGVSVEDIAKTVQATMSGVVVTKISAGGRRFDVRIKLSEADLVNPAIIKNIPIRNNRGQTITLGDVADLEETPGLLATTRENRERAVSVFGVRTDKNESLDKVIASMKEKFVKLLPESYSVVESGASQDFASSSKNFLVIFLLGILISYMVLGAQFNSFLSPVIILLALPFSFAGALLSLYITGSSLNLYSAIGMILLAGIVKKNSIMLVEFTTHLRTVDKMNVNQALLTACPMRLRPIIMTTFTTIAGTLPAALALGPGAESRIPLAVAVIGGLILSTVLSLFVVPCAYQIAYSQANEPHQAS